MWTNTVCSHPLANEKDESNGIEGVKLAAQRKISHELGIPAEEVPLDKFKFLTRIHYKAKSDEQWGEHEIDYILFMKCPKITVTPNFSEVKDYKFVSLGDVKMIVQNAVNGTLKITPWFHLIFDKFLAPWWEQLQKNPNELPQDHIIHRLL